MTTTFPSSAPSATNQPPTFAVESLVRIQHNEGLYRIDSPAAWSDGDHETPTHYNITGPSGQFHKMVPAERLILHSNPRSAVLYTLQELDAILRNPEPQVRHTHCWRCKTTLSHLKTKVCPKCRGLLCECGGCRCNWPFF